MHGHERTSKRVSRNKLRRDHRRLGDLIRPDTREKETRADHATERSVFKEPEDTSDGK